MVNQVVPFQRLLLPAAVVLAVLPFGLAARAQARDAGHFAPINSAASSAPVHSGTSSAPPVHSGAPSPAPVHSAAPSPAPVNSAIAPAASASSSALLPVASPASPNAAGFAPDPPPMVTRHQWVLDFTYESGALTNPAARRVELQKPTATPRLMGRFAFELYVGKELLERVRFDFPLLGADESAGQRRRWDAPPSFERHLTSRAGVMVPHSERATRAVVVDRASGQVWQLAWPPSSGGGDAGAPQAPSPTR